MRKVFHVGFIGFFLTLSSSLIAKEIKCSSLLQKVEVTQLSESTKNDLKKLKAWIACRLKPELSTKKFCDARGWTLDRMDGTSLYFCKKEGDQRKTPDISKLCQLPYQKQEVMIEYSSQKTTIVRCSLFQSEKQVCQNGKFTKMIPLKDYDATLRGDEQAFLCEKN